jgi:Zn-dependent peptidase ImmA (M78 family)
LWARFSLSLAGAPTALKAGSRSSTSAFLLPLAPFGEDFFAVNLDTLVTLKPKWKVSVAMMVARAQRAGFISEDTARWLWINYSRHGWKRKEPYDDSMEPEARRSLKRWDLRGAMRDVRLRW